MTSASDNQSYFPAWGISLAFHGAALGVALLIAAQTKPTLQEDVFKWDVALVEAMKSESDPEQPAETVVPLSKPKRVSEKVRPTDRKIVPSTPTSEPVSPIEPMVEPLPPRKEPIESKADSVAVADPPAPVEAPPSQLEPTPDVSAAPTSQDAPALQEAPQSLPHENSLEDLPMQTVAAVTPSSDMKLDNRWVGDLLWRRVAELKRYPNSARVNGQEGKVILKAVIRADGQLIEISVQKSSGHDLLDAAAMEAVKLACPLHMKRNLGQTQIVLSLPIVYSLAN